jgi:hypothetical protein
MTKEFIQFEERLRAFMRGSSSWRFGELALELYRLQFDHNVPYRRFCQGEGQMPQSTRTWHEVPAIPTNAFKEVDLSVIPADARTTEFWSSGTTEQRPSRHFHNPSSLAVYEDSLLEWGSKHLPWNTSSLLSLTPPAAVAPRSSLVHMFDVIFRKQRESRSAFVGYTDSEGGWSVNLERTISLLSICAHSREPIGLLGTAFNFVHLFDALRERELRFQLPLGSWILETGGYKGRSRSVPKIELHDLACEFLGIARERIICEYGMSELSSQAYDISLVERGEAARRFRFPPWARARVVSPENGCEVPDGETGLLRVFDLANVYSAMAIQTQDLAVRRGDGFELIGRAERAEPRGCSLMAV